MNWEFLEMIPPEQIGLLIAAIVGAFGSVMAGLAYYIRWLFRYQARVQDEKLSAMRQERELEKAEVESAQRRKDAEIQRQLDETQNSKETIVRLFSELSESRKEDKEIRASYERRESAFIEAMSKIANATQGIESNSASTLALLKENKDNGEIIVIKQDMLLKNSEETHRKINDLAKDIQGIANKLESVSVGRNGDRKILDEIKEGLTKITQGIKRLEDTTQPIPRLENVEISTPEANKVDELTKDGD